MAAFGVIAGRVHDDQGAPLRRVWVRALRGVYRAGERQFEMVEFAPDE